MDNKDLVVHCKIKPYDVYIGRSKDPKKGKWGNPYSHEEGTLAEYKVATREEAVECFRKYLLKNVDLMKQILTLKGKVLGCWCKPKSCHGDIIVEFINKIDNGESLCDNCEEEDCYYCNLGCPWCGHAHSLDGSCKNCWLEACQINDEEMLLRIKDLIPK